jgi:hypothetical protein
MAGSQHAVYELCNVVRFIRWQSIHLSPGFTRINRTQPRSQRTRQRVCAHSMQGSLAQIWSRHRWEERKHGGCKLTYFCQLPNIEKAVINARTGIFDIDRPRGPTTLAKSGNLIEDFSNAAGESQGGQAHS